MKKRTEGPENLELFALEYTASTANVFTRPEDRAAIEAREKLMGALREKMPEKSDLEIKRWSLGVAQSFLKEERE